MVKKDKRKISVGSVYKATKKLLVITDKSINDFYININEYFIILNPEYVKYHVKIFHKNKVGFLDKSKFYSGSVCLDK